MTRLLLDTNALLWLLRGHERASDLANAIGGGAHVVVSVVSLFEIAVKQAIGKLDEDLGAVRGVLAERRIEELPVLGRHVETLARLPLVHRDPFDRLLVAQAQAERLSIVTSDAQIARYPVDVVAL